MEDGEVRSRSELRLARIRFDAMRFLDRAVVETSPSRSLASRCEVGVVARRAESLSGEPHRAAASVNWTNVN